MKFIKWSLLLIILLMFSACEPTEAFQIAYRLKVGSTYAFEVKSHVESHASSGEFDEKSPAEAVDTISVTVLAYRSGVFVLDITTGSRHFRRLMREDGTLLLSPGERSSDLPLFLTFPAADWPAGKVHRVDSSFDVGGKPVPARFEIVPSSRDAAKGIVSMKFAGTVDLPSDRAIQRKLNVKGSLGYDEKVGCPSTGEWVVEYSFDFANKEIAVIRPIWNIKETRTVSFHLQGVTQ
ncbi:MAG: hypothetical protein HQM09_02275 [Candidatus Riflebacteria bacterium]|nr:hypothetical protein [Candidatus Riflebacteria bacterium]